MNLRERWFYFWVVFGLALFAIGVTIISIFSVVSINQSQSRQSDIINFVCTRQDREIAALDNLYLDAVKLTNFSFSINKQELAKNIIIEKTLKDLQTNQANVIKLEVSICRVK